MMFKKNGKTEDVLKRKSYYGFSGNYPGQIGSGKFMLGESKTVKKREIIRKIMIILLLILVFAGAYVFTDICLDISEKPIEQKISAPYAVAYQKTE